MTPLVISEGALQLLPALQLGPNWFMDQFNNKNFPNVNFMEKDFGKFCFTSNCSKNSKLLIIKRSSDGLFDSIPAAERRQAFDRCTRVALRSFDAGVILNPRWLPYHWNNRVSIFAYSLGQGERIAIEVDLLGSRDVYVYDFGNHAEILDLANLTPDYNYYSEARKNFDEICVQFVQSSEVSVDGQIELDVFETKTIVQGFTYSDWYPLHLSKDQLKFVEHSVTGPLRLRGAAGTGKTLAMVIKALKTKYDADQAGDSKKILFVTHSWSMAEYVDRLIDKIDIDRNSNSKIDVFPLLFIANKRDYTKVGREPLGIDSEDGKKLALREISKLVGNFLEGDWVAYKAECSKEFIDQIEADANSKSRKIFCWDLLIEFGCVISAQGILTHNADRERYLRVKRLRWMMPLDTNSEKNVVFLLWAAFMAALREKRWISSDQIISDYLNDLSTFYWEAARTAEGYDYIFVDEMHLFNAQERLIFHNLLCDGGRPPLVVMALDPKQSPRETFTNVSDERDSKIEGVFERARLPNSEKIDLTNVYRYTPEISRLIKSVNDVAPGLDFPEDWDIPQGISNVESGDVPLYSIAKNKLETYKLSISLVQAYSRESWKRKGRSAVLCLDDERFDEYVAAAVAQHGSDIIGIRSRDDTEKLRYAGKKIVYSTPEYVAGLQFDSVVILDANEEQVPDGKYRNFHLRRFLSELYLGFSRAEKRLHIIASQDGGGLTKILAEAVNSGILQKYKE